MAQDCVFCKIAVGELSAQVEMENEDIIAFRDIHPEAPVHILIIPKKHIASLVDVTDKDSGMLGRIQLAAAELAEKHKLDRGFRLVTNCGHEGGQTVEHLHYHLLGGRQLTWPPG